MQLFEVRGHLRLGTLHDQPLQLEKEAILTVWSADGSAFRLLGAAACLSLRLRRLVEFGGVNEGVRLPLGRSALAQVVEYLMYHKDVPPTEISMPLVSNDLVKCGVLPWDAQFVSVTADALFDLALAASLLEIPSLFVLAGAKLTTLIKGKSFQQLHVQFRYADDLPGGEMQVLQDGFAKAQGRLASISEGSSLAGSSVMLGGALLAARRHRVSSEVGELSEASPAEPHSWRQAVWRAAVLTDWRLLTSAPDELTSDRGLMEAALCVSAGEALQYAVDTLKNDDSFVTCAMACSHGKALRFAGERFRADRGFMSGAVQAYGGDALSAAADEVRADRAFVMEAIVSAGPQAGDILRGAAIDLLADKELIAQAIQQDPSVVASAGICSDREVSVAVARANGSALRYMPPQFRADAEVVQAAVASDLAAASFAHVARRLEIGLADPSELEPKQRGRAIERAVWQAPERVTLSWIRPQSQDFWSYSLKLQKFLCFSGFGTVMGGFGQSNYIAANMLLDRLPGCLRPEVDGSTLMWGAIGGVGMRVKAFGSMDVLNATPENQLNIFQASRILEQVCCRQDIPEWMAASNHDTAQREAMLAPHISASWPSETAFSEDHASPGDGLISFGPLGGWPRLMQEVRVREREELEPGCTSQLRAGSRVRLVGIKSKCGAKGRVAKRTGNGRWRVVLEEGGGNALLAEEFLEVITSGTDDDDLTDRGVALSRVQVCTTQPESRSILGQEEAVRTRSRSPKEAVEQVQRQPHVAEVIRHSSGMDWKAAELMVTSWLA